MRVGIEIGGWNFRFLAVLHGVEGKGEGWWVRCWLLSSIHSFIHISSSQMYCAGSFGCASIHVTTLLALEMSLLDISRGMRLVIGLVWRDGAIRENKVNNSQCRDPRVSIKIASSRFSGGTIPQYQVLLNCIRRTPGITLLCFKFHRIIDH